MVSERVAMRWTMHWGGGETQEKPLSHSIICLEKSRTTHPKKGGPLRAMPGLLGGFQEEKKFASYAV